MKRSAPLRRTSSLRTTSTLARRTRLNQRSKTNSHARRERGRDFMAWTSRQPCIVKRFFVQLQAVALETYAPPARAVDIECCGRIEVDHAGNRFTQGNGKRAHDRTGIPICTKHHVMRTNWAGTLGQAGIFYGFTREQHRRWCDAAIALHHKLASVARIEVPTC